jgi:hypothetical protein
MGQGIADSGRRKGPRRNGYDRKEETMAFADNLKRLPGVETIERIDLYDAGGSLAATLENKPGKAGSLAVYRHLVLRHGRIDARAAQEGLELFAEHAVDARAHPGKHPNVDRLFEVIDRGLSYSAAIVPR